MQYFLYLCGRFMITHPFLSDIEVVANSYPKEQIVAVAGEAVAPRWRAITGYNYPLLEFKGGEGEKTPASLERIWDFLLDHGITRRGLLIAIGGGVVTDICGLAAATYKRGIDYLNIPTTLLAMVDASTGGKTGVNYHGLKNAIGTFYPPVKTLIYPQWLSSLPAREMLSGFGEMLKTGLLDKDHGPMCLWHRLLQYDLDVMNVEKLTPIIAECLSIKEHIVASDPHETGMRKVLNLGHTFGHAIEEANIERERNQESIMPHGYAVVYGLIAELYLSVIKLDCPREPLQQLTQIMLHYYGRPQCKCSEREHLIVLMQQDKKNECAAEINCTLLKNIGEPVINQSISTREATEALEYLFAL